MYGTVSILNYALYCILKANYSWHYCVINNYSTTPGCVDTLGIVLYVVL